MKIESSLPTDSPEDFPLREARRLVKGLYKPNPAIYWTDFLLSVSVGWAAFALGATQPLFSFWQILCCLIAGLALYRAVVFTHELSHLSAGAFGLFRLAWNLLCGLPMMVPSFMYRGVHMEHHRTRVYGTEKDGEYLPFASNRPARILLYLAQAFVLPALLLARFIILTPLAYLSPVIRRTVWQRASSLSIDADYRRPLSAMEASNDWRWQEPAAFCYGAFGVIFILLDILPLAAVGIWYVVMVMILLANSMRTLAAHRYRNPGNQSMSVAEQFLDSVDVPGKSWLTPLWAPVGLRYHATHHLFPAMPYHNLGKAYRKLVAELPDSRPYLRSTRKGLWHALAGLWKEAGGVSQWN